MSLTANNTPAADRPTDWTPTPATAEALARLLRSIASTPATDAPPVQVPGPARRKPAGVRG